MTIYDGTSFTTYTEADGLPSGFVTSLAPARDWMAVGTGSGLSRFDGTGFVVAGELAGPVFSLAADGAGGVWAVGRGEDAVRRWDGSRVTAAISVRGRTLREHAAI